MQTFRLHAFKVAVCSLFVCFLAISSHAQCQDQVCWWNPSISCYQCQSGAGFGCSTGSCGSCTESRCKGFQPDPVGEPGELMVGLRSGQRSLTCARAATIEEIRLSALESRPSKGVLLRMLDQPDAPAQIYTATHTRTDLFSAGTLRNEGGRLIMGYRVGWVALFPSSEPEVSLGEWMNVPPGIEGGAYSPIQAQAVSFGIVEKGATHVFFFIGAVKFAGGEVWELDVRKLREEVQPKVKSKS